MHALDLFSGIGGISLGLERAGVHTVAFCEIDKKCQRVLRKHWPETPIETDVTVLDCERYLVDIVAGGFPCQPFSSAARGRNNKPDLWPHMLRIVRDLRRLRPMRPLWVLAENVPGLGDHGVDRVCSDLEREAFTCWPFDMDTAPPGRHRGRRRFIIMAHANGQGQSRRAVDAQVARLPKVSGRSAPDDAPPLGMDDGLPGRMDALRQIGNSMSPWAAEMCGRAIMRVHGSIS